MRPLALIGFFFFGARVAAAHPRSDPARDLVPDTLSVPVQQSAPARAPEPEPVALVEPPWPQIAAVFPGILWHGAGTWLEGRTLTSERLSVLEGAGVLGALLSGVVLYETGAARHWVGPAALVGIAGVGTFASSFLANLYAVWAPADGWGSAERTLPLLEASLGYQYVDDPVFRFHHFLTTRVEGRAGAWHVLARGDFAPDQSNERVELCAGYRLWGLQGALMKGARDGSYLEPQLAYSEHRFDASGFTSRVLGLSIEGRLDSERLLPDVHGAFFQASAGWAKQWIAYDLPGVDALDSTSLLLAHVGFGIYLGHRSEVDEGRGGELELYYDHRHDGFAAGLKTAGIPSGVLGHFGLGAEYLLSPRWGVRADTELGSAWLAGVSAVLRVGAP
jgi:hypothetical protein